MIFISNHNYFLGKSPFVSNVVEDSFVMYLVSCSGKYDGDFSEEKRKQNQREITQVQQGRPTALIFCSSHINSYSAEELQLFALAD